MVEWRKSPQRPDGLKGMVASAAGKQGDGYGEENSEKASGQGLMEPPE